MARRPDRGKGEVLSEQDRLPPDLRPSSKPPADADTRAGVDESEHYALIYVHCSSGRSARR